MVNVRCYLFFLSSLQSLVRVNESSQWLHFKNQRQKKKKKKMGAKNQSHKLWPKLMARPSNYTDNSVNYRSFSIRSANQKMPRCNLNYITNTPGQSNIGVIYRKRKLEGKKKRIRVRNDFIKSIYVSADAAKFPFSFYVVCPFRT